MHQNVRRDRSRSGRTAWRANGRCFSPSRPDRAGQPLPMLAGDASPSSSSDEHADRRRRDPGDVPRRPRARAAALLRRRRRRARPGLSELRRRAVARFAAGAGRRRRAASSSSSDAIVARWASPACRSPAGPISCWTGGRSPETPSGAAAARCSTTARCCTISIPGLAARYLREPARRPAYRAARRHAEFIGNLPLSAETIRARLEACLESRRCRALAGRDQATGRQDVLTEAVTLRRAEIVDVAHKCCTCSTCVRAAKTYECRGWRRDDSYA